MAKKPLAAPVNLSRKTGLYFMCPTPVLHVKIGQRKVAQAVYRGKKGWAVMRCSECKSQIIFGQDWKDNYGLTREQAEALGADVREG